MSKVFQLYKKLKIHYKIGDNVKKNDVLFTLDSKDILRNIEQISAEMKYEKETLDILEKKLSLRLSRVQNANNLKKQNIITQDNLDGINILLLENQQVIDLDSLKENKLVKFGSKLFSIQI